MLLLVQREFKPSLKFSYNCKNFAKMLQHQTEEIALQYISIFCCLSSLDFIVFCISVFLYFLIFIFFVFLHLYNFALQWISAGAGAVVYLQRMGGRRPTVCMIHQPNPSMAVYCTLEKSSGVCMIHQPNPHCESQSLCAIHWRKVLECT